MGIRAAENTGHGVVVLRRYRVEFMVVATGTGNRQTKEGTCRGVNLFVDDVQFEQSLVALIQWFRAKREETGGDQLVVGRFAFVAAEQVPGDLFVDELLEGFVAIERAYDVISVTPSVRIGVVSLHSI